MTEGAFTALKVGYIIMIPIGTSFVLSIFGSVGYSALGAHVSPQSGLPRIRTQDLKDFWFALLVPSKYTKKQMTSR